MNSKNKKISLNDLSKYSDWPKRIIRCEEFEKKYKTSEEVTREYNLDKWGELLEKLKNTEGTLKESIDLSFDKCADIPVLIDNELTLLSQFSTFERYITLIADTLQKHSPIANLVELGAGSGNIILSLAKHNFFKNAGFYAGEYAENGINLIKMIAEKEKIDIKVGKCDFTKSRIIDIGFPNNSVVFTSFSIVCIPKLGSAFLDYMLDLKPSLVIHFEPCYDYYNIDTVLGLMQKRYIELNDYNTDLVSVLNKGQKENKIKILDVRKNVFGANPFLPASVITWKPYQQER
jgi:hypothetical protein